MSEQKKESPAKTESIIATIEVRSQIFPITATVQLQVNADTTDEERLQAAKTLLKLWVSDSI
jgi:hypothetical protein